MRRTSKDIQQPVINTSALADEEEVDEAEVGQGVFQSITNNVKPMTRIERMNGDEYMVVPMVMLTEGVHAGSNGPLYYPRNELAKTPAVWNHKPVVVYHPTANGSAISACEPTVISRRKVGLIFNTRFEPGKNKAPGRLKAEAWLQVNRLKEVDERILQAINKGQMVEVSTGLFTDNEQTEGLWNKERYTSIARNYRPDHLAILPDEKGACSIADGAGLLRNSEMSHEELRQQLSNLVSGKNKMAGSDQPCLSCWVRDVFGSFFVYSMGNKLYRQEYTKDKDGIKLTGMAEEVTSRQTYRTKNGTIINTASNGESNMSKKKIINTLIANENTGFLEADRAWLEEQDVALLEKMVPTDNEGYKVPKGGAPMTASDGKNEDASETITGDDGKVAPKKQGSKTGAAKNQAKKDDDEDDDDEDGKDEAEDKWEKKLKKPTGNAAQPQTVEEFIANAPEGMREVLEQSVATHNAAKDRLIKTLTANKACRFTPEFLATKPIRELQAMVDLAGGSQPKPTMNYAGQGGVMEGPVDNREPEEVLPVPELTFNKRSND